MMNRKLQIIKQTILLIFVAATMSCTNIVKTDDDKADRKSGSIKAETEESERVAYIKLKLANSLARTVLPDIQLNDLTSLELKGSKNNEEEQTLGNWTSVSQMQAARIAVSTGLWTFTLTAKAGGENGTILSGCCQKEIELGDNTLSFTLSISDDGAGEENRVGSFEITLNYANAENADKVSYVTASLENMAGTPVTGFAQPVQLTPASNSVSFAANDIPAGTYRARVKFYAASNQTGVADFEIASYRELVQISSGLTSSATRKIESFDNLYTITYHLNGGSLPAGTTLQESFTRKSSIPLPTSTTISRDYYNFGGWYTDSNFTTGNEISTVSNITTNLDVYAKFTPIEYSINFISNGGTIFESIPSSYTYVSDTILLPEPQRNNYVFRGWFLEEDFSGERQREIATGSHGDKTYYAKWINFSEFDDGFIFVEGGTVVGSSDYDNSEYNQYSSGAFPSGRTVTLSSFYMSDHELTQGEYETYCCYTSSTPSSRYGVGTDYPAYNVSWYDAIVYCNLKSMAEGLTPCYALSGEKDPKKWTGIKSSNGKYSCSYTSSNSTWNSITCNMSANGYRLPTEAEWEYAARGGQKTYGTAAFANYFAGATTTNYSDESNSDLDSVGWYFYNVCNNGVTGSEASYGTAGYGTHIIKQKAPNALGLYDMSGNVSEWCWDWYGSISTSETVTDPCGATSGSYRLNCGGCWNYSANFCSVSCLDGFNPNGRDSCVDFRLVRSAITVINLSSEYGNVPEKFYAQSASVPSKLPTPEETGWIFRGWYSDSAFAEESKVTNAFTLTEGLTLYAKWINFSEFDDGFIFVEGGTVVGSDDYNQYDTGVFPAGRTVTLSSFYMSDHELTQGEYETYCCYTSSTPSSDYGAGADYPAYNVNWYDAIVYCNLKSIAEGLTPCYALSGEKDPKKWTGIKYSSGKYSCSYTSFNSKWDSIICDMTANGYRLPTEAEWEYAARGGQETYGTSAFAYYFAGATTTNYSAESNSDLDSVGWYWYNVCNNGVTGSEASSGNAGYGTHIIKQKAPNALGLYDMSGNVLEWCWDWCGSISTSETETDPCGASSGFYRLFRGGGWDNFAYGCSVSYRDYNNPSSRGSDSGFRLVRSAE